MSEPLTIDAGDDAPVPWDSDKAMHDKLEEAGWRYAIMIGITDPYLDDEKLSQAVRDADAAKYPHFIHRDELNRPIWDWTEAVTFVSEVTGYSREISEQWLEWDWPS